MPYDTGEPLVEFTEIPSADGILEPLFNKILIFLQILGTWGLTRFVLWYCSPSNANGPVIRTSNILTLIGNCVKVYAGGGGNTLRALGLLRLCLIRLAGIVGILLRKTP